jgi:hypothetical protein
MWVAVDKRKEPLVLLVGDERERGEEICGLKKKKKKRGKLHLLILMNLHVFCKHLSNIQSLSWVYQILISFYFSYSVRIFC